MRKYIIAFLVILGVFYFIQAPIVSDQSGPRIYTARDEFISQYEGKLTLVQRYERIRHFRTTVQEALNRRVKPNEYVPANEIPKVMKDAIVATEDKRFYNHGGIDFYGVTRAFYTNLVAGKTVEGGSTITQQLVKNLFLSSNRVWSRKLEEALLALLMEHFYTKDEILTMYLNCIYYGNDYYGIKEASQGYFAEEPDKLDLAQAALLAGLPQAPSYFNPNRNPVAAMHRRGMVLRLMVSQNLISNSDYKKAYSQPLTRTVALPTQ